MNCACSDYDGKFGLNACGCHHWRERAAHLRGIREALEAAHVPADQQAEIVTKLERSHEYIEAQAAFQWVMR